MNTGFFKILIKFSFVWLFVFRFGSSFFPPVTFSLMHWTDLSGYLYSESHYCWRVGFVRVQVSVWANLATVTLSVWIYLFFSVSLALSHYSFISKGNSKPTFFPLLLRLLNSIWTLKKMSECHCIRNLHIKPSSICAQMLQEFFNVAFLQPFMLNQLVFWMIFGGWMKSVLLKFNRNLSNIQNRQPYLMSCPGTSVFSKL